MKLKRGFYARPCLDVARELVGKFLLRRAPSGVSGGRIVEVEAYVHEEDQACHARFGRTKRGSMLYGPPGHAYVYLIYGMYDCFNVVAEPEHSPAAVLIRALEPTHGVDAGTDGPGKLTRALGITRAHNGVDLCGPGQTTDLWIEDRGGPVPRLHATPRIGIDYAGEWADKPWRFVDADSRWLSKKIGSTNRKLVKPIQRRE
jgi:DNA-3-methyladenine glycosylase